MTISRAVATVLIACFIVAVLFVGLRALSPRPAGDEITFNEPQSLVRVRIHETATTSSIGVRLNKITDASDPRTSREWATFNLESGLGSVTLAAPRGAMTLVANVTVNSVQHDPVKCSYADFALVTRDKSAYYPGYAVCNASCSKDLLVNRTLSRDSANDVYLLFSLPATAQTSELVYTGSNPPIVISIT
jgi:hypothetical protein